MAKSSFYLRVSSDTFEHYSGIGYQKAGGCPERFIPIENFWSLHLSVVGDIFDADGNLIGCKFRNNETKQVQDVFPGKVYNFSVWTTAVDDDGCPEDICIDFYVEILPRQID